MMMNAVQAEQQARQQFTLVVLQLSSLCNLNCSYCYVPDRQNKAKMSSELIERIFDLTVACPDNAGHTFDFLFHAGEPMAVGLETMREIVDRCIAKAHPAVHYRFTLQTNGVLIDDAWAAFFTEYGFAVGVSIDGPAFLHDATRVNWAGQGTHAQSVRGVKKLLEYGHTETGCLATINKNATKYPDQIMDFFLDLGVASLGFNLEDVENAHRQTSFGADRDSLVHTYREDYFRPFFERIFERWWPERHRLRVREFADVLRAAALRKQDPEYYRFPDCARPLGIITVDRSGAITTFAPEFAGATAPEYDNFCVGHILEIETLRDIVNNANFISLSRDIGKGIDACRTNCEYFSVCGSSYVSNRYFEYKDFTRAETFTCQMMRQLPADIAFDGIQRISSQKILQMA
jgi:uncharacterized protein